MEVAQNGQIPCFSGEVTGEILASSSEPEVSEFTFATQDTFFLDTEVFLGAGTGGAALAFPDGEFDGAGSSVRRVDFFLMLMEVLHYLLPHSLIQCGSRILKK